MLSSKVIKYLIYLGIVLAFLAVPVGSYIMVKRANDKIASLETQVITLETDIKGLEDRIEFAEDLKEAQVEIDAKLEQLQGQIEEADKQFEDVIVDKSSRTPSSKVLKDTFEVLRRNVK